MNTDQPPNKPIPSGDGESQGDTSISDEKHYHCGVGTAGKRPRGASEMRYNEALERGWISTAAES